MSWRLSDYRKAGKVGWKALWKCLSALHITELSMLTIIQTDYQPPVLMAAARCLAMALVTLEQILELACIHRKLVDGEDTQLAALGNAQWS